MKDDEIVRMYVMRNEEAIVATQKKYHNYCFSIANNILGNVEDANECINDALLVTWNTIPPNHPPNFSAYIGKITRNIALNKYKFYSAKKRKLSQTYLCLEELSDCVSGINHIENISDSIYFKEVIDAFLAKLSEVHRKIFICRYLYFFSISDIATKYNVSENYVKVSLHRSKEKLKIILTKEGIF